MKDKFLITGAGGFLGSTLTGLLYKAYSKAGFVLVGHNKKIVFDKKRKNIKIIYGDLRTNVLWGKIPKDITHVFHLAAVIPHSSNDKTKASLAMANLTPLAYLIEYSNKWPHLKQIIYSSSISVYAKDNCLLSEDSCKRPSDIYGAAKLSGEELLSCLESKKIKIACLRYSSIYGYGQYDRTVLPIMVNRAISKKDILVYGDGKRTQDFVECFDTANANILAYKNKAEGAFNIGSGVSVTMNELASLINKIFADGKSRIIHVLFKCESDACKKIDISKAKKILHYKPLFRIEKGLYKLKEDMSNLKRCK